MDAAAVVCLARLSIPRQGPRCPQHGPHLGQTRGSSHPSLLTSAGVTSRSSQNLLSSFHIKATGCLVSLSLAWALPSTPCHPSKGPRGTCEHQVRAHLFFGKTSQGHLSLEGEKGSHFSQRKSPNSPCGPPGPTQPVLSPCTPSSSLPPACSVGPCGLLP